MLVLTVQVLIHHSLQANTKDKEMNKQMGRSFCSNDRLSSIYEVYVLMH